MAYPLDFMSPKLPGLGDVDWGKYVSALTDIGFEDVYKRQTKHFGIFII